MSSCYDLDPESIKRAQIYYYELLSGVSDLYGAMHRYIFQFLCTVGVLANICVVVVLLRPAMRKNPFNLFLIAIAICDMSLMASYFVYKQVEPCHPYYFAFPWIVYTYAYAILSVFVHSASLWMTVNMAVLRYLVLKAGASSSRRWPRLNTYKAAGASVVAALLIAAIGSAPNTLRYEIKDNGRIDVPGLCLNNASKYAGHYKPGDKVEYYTLVQPSFWNCGWERFSFWTAGLLLKLVPCLLLTVFMTLLVRMLVEARERRSRLQGAKKPVPAAPQSTVAADGRAQQQAQKEGGGAKQQAERTTAMLTIIVAVFLITELPQGILVVAIGVQPRVRFAMSQLTELIDLLSLLNSSVNFILYATMSNLFRHEFLHTFGQCCPKKLAQWLQGGCGESAEKASPPPRRNLEPGTVLTALNGRPHSPSESPARLASTGKQIGVIAHKGLNGSVRHLRADSRKKVTNNRSPARDSLPVAVASDAESLLKKTQDREEEDQRDAEEEEQQRKSLTEN